MLSGLKDKLLSNINRVNALNPAKEEAVPVPDRIELNPNAGATLLAHYQQQWADIHRSNEDNAVSVARVATQISEMNSRITRDCGNVSQMIHLLSVPNNIKVSVETCVGQLKSLYDSLDAVERQLLVLEDVIEEAELEHKKAEHRLQLTLYKEKKMANFEKVRGEISTKHKRRLKDEEARQKNVLLERQQVFQEAFASDLETFKTLGTIPKIDAKAKPSTALLEEIQLDLDEQDLESFLQT